MQWGARSAVPKNDFTLNKWGIRTSHTRFFTSQYLWAFSEFETELKLNKVMHALTIYVFSSTAYLKFECL